MRHSDAVELPRCNIDDVPIKAIPQSGMQAVPSVLLVLVLAGIALAVMEASAMLRDDADCSTSPYPYMWGTYVLLCIAAALYAGHHAHVVHKANQVVDTHAHVHRKHAHKQRGTSPTFTQDPSRSRAQSSVEALRRQLREASSPSSAS